MCNFVHSTDGYICTYLIASLSSWNTILFVEYNTIGKTLFLQPLSLASCR